MDHLSTYKDLFHEQLSAHTFYEEEAILGKMEQLWKKMTPEERIEAERFITESMPH